MSMSKYWCFTLNNYSDEDIRKLKESEYTYLVFGKEVGESGTPHLQGYIELITRRRLVTVKRIAETAHFEVRKSTAVNAANYCKKDGQFEEYGTISKTEVVKKSNKELIDRVKTTNLRSILEDPPNVSGVRLIQLYLTYNEAVRKEKPITIWLWGSTGSGKSRIANEILEEIYADDVYWKDGEKWWDGYDKHSAIVIDDFRANNMKFNYLLRILDRYAMRVENKGGYRQLNSKCILITSIKKPDDVYNLPDEPIRQLIRRIDVNEQVTDNNINEIKAKIRCACAVVSGNTVTETTAMDVGQQEGVVA